MRINIYGVPGSGKTTLASELFAELKKRKLLVEQVTEQAKPYALKGIPIVGWLQVEVFIQQLRCEEQALTKVPLLVTDCPLWLMVAYARYHENPHVCELADFADRFDRQFPSCSVYLEQREEYDTLGRLHTQKELPAIDYEIRSVLTTTRGYRQGSHITSADAKEMADIISERIKQ